MTAEHHPGWQAIALGHARQLAEQSARLGAEIDRLTRRAEEAERKRDAFEHQCQVNLDHCNNAMASERRQADWKFKAMADLKEAKAAFLLATTTLTEGVADLTRERDALRAALPEWKERALKAEDAIERVALLDEVDGHELTVNHAFEAVAIATKHFGVHPSIIGERRDARKSAESAALRATAAPRREIPHESPGR